MKSVFTSQHASATIGCLYSVVDEILGGVRLHNANSLWRVVMFRSERQPELQ